MKKWGYKLLRLSTENYGRSNPLVDGIDGEDVQPERKVRQDFYPGLVSYLQELGLDGWEAVGFSVDTPRGYVLLKRELPEETNPKG